MAGEVTPGRFVTYVLSADDVTRIRKTRSKTALMLQIPAFEFGNEVQAGEEYPAVVVRVFEPTSDDLPLVVNLQVLLDGPLNFWATSRQEAAADATAVQKRGTWFWPDQPAPAGPVA